MQTKSPLDFFKIHSTEKRVTKSAGPRFNQWLMDSTYGYIKR